MWRKFIKDIGILHYQSVKGERQIIPKGAVLMYWCLTLIFTLHQTIMRQQVLLYYTTVVHWSQG